MCSIIRLCIPRPLHVIAARDLSLDRFGVTKGVRKRFYCIVEYNSYIQSLLLSESPERTDMASKKLPLKSLVMAPYFLHLSAFLQDVIAQPVMFSLVLS